MEPSMEPPSERPVEPYFNAPPPSRGDPPSTRRGNWRRWLLIGGLALAFVLALGAGAVVGAALHPTAQAASFAPGSGNTAQGPGFGRRQLAGTPGASGGPGGPGAAGSAIQCGPLTVTSVSGQTIVATGPDGKSITIQTSSSTQYTKGGQAAAASDVTVGSKIHVDGTANSDGSINATRIDIQ